LTKKLAVAHFPHRLSHGGVMASADDSLGPANFTTPRSLQVLMEQRLNAVIAASREEGGDKLIVAVFRPWWVFVTKRCADQRFNSRHKLVPIELREPRLILPECANSNTHVTPLFRGKV
jgi:hypothetical protein